MGKRVVEFSEGSKYYYELGNYYYNKNNLDRALAYYQRALAVDPANAVNHFNVACLLSELGKYRESISIFKQVTEMDSELSESWFWLAMNHGQLQQYKEACHYLRKYLEQDPEGDYSWQAEEILDYMRSDLPMLSPGQKNRIDRLCNNGVKLVSQGRLREAIKCFTRASDIEPEMTAPRNNLALSWFYLGDINKAIALTRDILEYEPGNVFANCNLTTFYYILDDQLALRRQVQVLDGLWGDDPDEMLKLGTTYGLLGLDRKALDVFRLLHSTGLRSFELMLLLGISFFNCGNISEAAKIFDRINELEADNPYRVYRLICSDPDIKKLPYHLRIPDEAIAVLLEADPPNQELEKIIENPDLWPQLLWIIRNGNGVARQRLLESISSLKHQPLIDKVLAYAWDARVETNRRREIYGVFLRAGIAVWARRYWDKGQFSPNRVRVLEETLASLREQGYGFSALNGAYTAWNSFCRRHKGPIRTPQLWSAALIVLTKGLNELEDIAAEYGVVPAKLRQAVQQLSCYCL